MEENPYMPGGEFERMIEFESFESEPLIDLGPGEFLGEDDVILEYVPEDEPVFFEETETLEYEWNDGEFEHGQFE